MPLCQFHYELSEGKVQAWPFASAQVDWGDTRWGSWSPGVGDQVIMCYFLKTESLNLCLAFNKHTFTISGPSSVPDIPIFLAQSQFRGPRRWWKAGWHCQSGQYWYYRNHHGPWRSTLSLVGSIGYVICSAQCGMSVGPCSLLIFLWGGFSFLEVYVRMSL